MGQNENKMTLRLGDRVAFCIVILLIAILLFVRFRAEQGSTAEISVDGTIVQTLSLHENTSYLIEAHGHSLVVNVENGEAFVTEANCPDKVCEHTGRISASGTSIVCSAAHVSVTIRGGGETDVDFVAG